MGQLAGALKPGAGWPAEGDPKGVVTQSGKLTASAVLLEHFPGCFACHKKTSACGYAAHVPDTVGHRVHEAILSLGVTEVPAKLCECS